MADERKYSPNYHWALPLPQGNQIIEIKRIGDTITAIDEDFKAFVDAYNAHKHKFRDIEELPTTLEGYGITDAMTTEQVGNAISESGNTLSQSFAQALSSLSDTITKALGLRVRVDEAQEFSLAQKKRARDNIEAVGAVDKGAAGGVAPLGADGKVASTYLPALTTTATVGAAMAGANGKTTPDDGDFFGGVLAGGSTMFKTTWANIKAAFRVLFYTKDEVGAIVAGNMAGRAYPRRSDGAAINFMWSGQPGQPSWLFGANEPGTDILVYNPANFSVNYANSTWNAERLQGWDIPGIQNDAQNRANDRGYWRTRDYLLAEHVPVGGYIFAQCIDAVGTGGTVGGDRLAFGSANGAAGSRLNWGTWQACGTTASGGSSSWRPECTTLWKRIG